MITNKKHLLFADEYKLTNGLTEDAIRCYQIAYPKSKVESARVESYKLLQNPTIEKYINEYKENIRIERENNNLNQLKNQDNTNILQREKVLDMTSTILKLIYNKIVRGKEPSGADVQAYNSTAERLSKMQGFDKPTQNEVALTDIVIKGQKFAKKKK